jgi:mycothiol synthase
MSVRKASEAADRPQIDDLLALVERADGYPPLTEDAHIDYSAGAQRTGIVAVDGGAVVGYAHLRSCAGSVVVEPVIHPECRSTMARRLIKASIEEARPAQVRLWASDDDVVAAAAALGLQGRRSLHHLVAPLPPEERAALPDGVTVATFRPGDDEQAFLDLNAVAFAGHPDNAGWGRSDLTARTARPWFDAAGFFLARERGRLLGACWTKRHAGPVGEIYWVGVHPEARRAGLGRALTLIGLHHLSHGCDTGILYTESDNLAARRLYEMLGFRTLRVKRQLVG